MSLTSFIANSDNKIIKLNHKYSTSGKREMLMSNNITSINMISTLTITDVDPQKITSINLGSNIKTVEPSCFVNCTNLTSVTTRGNVKNIEQQAFHNCTSLKNVSFLSKTNTLKVNNIGLSAFANTGLQDVHISLSGTSTDTQIHAYAFAGCKQLTSMTNVGSNYLADYEFADCTALRSITLANSHSFSGEYSFYNCTALENVKIPANTFMVNNGLFYGCSHLTSVTFGEPSMLKFARCLGNDLFYGSAITSLTLPTSITSYTYISDNTLRGMPNLKELKFSGIQMKDIAEKAQEDLEFKPGIIYSDIKGTSNYGVFKKGTYKYSDYFQDVSTSTCKKAINFCKQNNIPVVVFHGNPSVSNCGLCQNFCSQILCTSKFLDWVKSENNKYIIIDCGNDGYMINELKEAYPSKGTQYVLALMYWKDTSGTVHKYGCGNAASTFKSSAQNMIDKMTSLFSGFDGTGIYKDVIVGDIFSSHCFGLNHDVIIKSSDGKQVNYEDDGSGNPGQLNYRSDIQVDRRTTDDFRYGQWYFNAKQLRQYADQNYLPCFVELGSKNCGPCEDFHDDVFIHPTFQNYVKSKKLLLSRIHVSTFDVDPGDYTAHSWMNPNIYPAGKMPIFMLYWKQHNGATVDGVHWSDCIHQNYAHYNDPSDKSYPLCPLTYDENSVTAWIESIVKDYSYTPQAKFNLPTINSYLTGKPRYQYYQNQSNDDYGRYFPTYSQTPSKEYDSYEISVRNSSGVITKYTLSPITTSNLPPDGTYQYFTKISMDTSYDSTYDISGIIFKIGKEDNSTYLNSDTYSYGAKTRDAYLSEIGLDASKITSQLTSFSSEIYLTDSSGNPTTQVDPNAFEPGDLVFNITRTYSTTGITRSSKTISKVKMYLSAEVQVLTDFDGDKYLAPTGTEYVLSSNFYYTTTSSSKVLWMYSFSNVE